MLSERDRLKGEGRSASRTRVDGGGRHLGTPRNERSSPSPSEIGLQSNRSLFRGPLLDYREHLSEEEIPKLLDACAARAGKSPVLLSVVTLALHTGMRKGRSSAWSGSGWTSRVACCGSR